MKFNVSTNFPQVKAAMRSNGAQVPFALSVALNNAAQEVVGVEQQVMERNFNRPTLFTVNSLFVKRSTKTDLKAMVKPKDAGAGERVVRKSFAGHFERAYADALKSAKAGKGRS